MWYRENFTPSRPRQAKGGIKAQSKGSKFGASWWAKRWIEVLESFNLGGRLSRGRSYARNGQVLSIDIAEGTVKAKVQGSRPKPYDIAIKVKQLAEADWKKVIEVLSSQALFSAKLLSGEMPQEIEQAFKDAKVSLFPERHVDLATDCSCPDSSNPCKHIAAVYYLLGEEFDRDPFLLFKLRGMSREDLLSRLGARKPAAKKTCTSAVPTAEPEPLPTDPAAFWSQPALPEDFMGPVEIATQHAALPRRLGNFPFWRGQERFVDVMESIYRDAAQKGLAVIAAEKADENVADGPS
jgi:uncharacterized Zn finger protein